MNVLTVTKNDGTSVIIGHVQQLSCGIQDVDAEGSGRNQSGDMFRDRVAVKRKLTCSFTPMASADMSAILNSVSDQFFQLTFPDAQSGTMQTMTCYVGDRSAPAYSFYDNNWLWKGLSMNFIER